MASTLYQPRSLAHPAPNAAHPKRLAFRSDV